MKLNHYTTNDYENKSGLLPTEKQTQSNPTCSELACPEFVEGVEPISKWRKPCLTAGIHYCSAFRKSLYTNQIRKLL